MAKPTTGETWEEVAVTDWAPATEAEVAMRDALRVDDQEQYFRILSTLDLLLPVSPEPGSGWGTWTAGGRTHVLAFTSPEAMRACLAEHAPGSRTMAYRELAAAWPHLDWWLAVNPGLPIEGYLPAWFVSQLARGDARLPGRASRGTQPPTEPLGRARVSVPPRKLAHSEEQRPSQPVEAAEPTSVFTEPTTAIPIPTVPAQPGPPSERISASIPATPATMVPTQSRTSEPRERTPDDSGFKPANELEEELLAATRAGRHDHFLSTLLLSKVLLPVADGADLRLRPGQEGFGWRTSEEHGETRVAVYTSFERLAEQAGGEVPTIEIRFIQLIRAWPDESWTLVVNPGTPITTTLPGQHLAGLASSAAEFGLDENAGAAGEGASPHRATQSVAEQPVPMQKVVAPSQLSWYLERNYDRVSGFVHREREVTHLRTPAQLVAALGLRYEGSPFDPGADEIYVIRWAAYRPGLYRIPYGGRTEAAMQAMQGWVIERAPFRGNGFAPSDSEDVIAEFKVDSVRLPHGAQLWRLRADGTSELVAVLDADGPHWRKVEEQ